MRLELPAWTRAISLAAVGCASVANREAAVPVTDQGQLSKSDVTPNGLRVSGEELDELASPNFGVLEVTFENPTQAWARIASVELDFGATAAKAEVSVPLGDDLTSLVQATAQRNAIAYSNVQTALALLALGGAAVSAASPNATTAAVGAGVGAGAVGALVLDERSETARTAEQAPRIPELHLLHGPFSVPPGLFAKRWIALETKDGADIPCVDHVTINYSVGAARERVLLQFRSQLYHSRWQPIACGA